MRIHLLAIGTKMPAWVEQGFQEYRKRLPPDMRLELEAIPLPKRSRATPPPWCAPRARPWKSAWKNTPAPTGWPWK